MSDNIMPRYWCHKEVSAAKILSMIARSDGDFELRFEIISIDPVVVTRRWFTCNSPNQGGYFVVSATGATSYIPAEYFEEGFNKYDDEAYEDEPYKDAVQ